MEEKKVSEEEYWNKLDKPKKPIALIITVVLLSLITGYLISSRLGH